VQEALGNVLHVTAIAEAGVYVGTGRRALAQEDVIEKYALAAQSDRVSYDGALDTHLQWQPDRHLAPLLRGEGMTPCPFTLHLQSVIPWTPQTRMHYQILPTDARSCGIPSSALTRLETISGAMALHEGAGPRGGHSWRWQCSTNSASVRKSRAFATLSGCVKDATRASSTLVQCPRPGNLVVEVANPQKDI
jgi:hypothetical protein